ncbi:hypothetical protein DKX38_002397 [Salix brachista]|uniref:Uncharacterized protein n=1 Tax=Salix brachista TaxID=2182728 RepID=A0A5N5NM48_9ROSI|nr:hypothetical protein DKX38_002397 [Salix brachista]
MRYGANLLCGGCWSSLYCMPASLAVSCSSMQCRNSNLMLGNVTVQQSSAGCNVTSCSYGGYVNGTIMTTLSTYLQPRCPGKCLINDIHISENEIDHSWGHEILLGYGKFNIFGKMLFIS